MACRFDPFLSPVNQNEYRGLSGEQRAKAKKDRDQDANG